MVYLQVKSYPDLNLLTKPIQFWTSQKPKVKSRAGSQKENVSLWKMVRDEEQMFLKPWGKSKKKIYLLNKLKKMKN